jgi:hypothetical protein
MRFQRKKQVGNDGYQLHRGTNEGTWYGSRHS